MRYTELCNHLATYVDRYNHGDSGALAEALTPYSNTERLHALFESTLRQNKWIENIARYSHLHPNGFAKIVLVSLEQLQLRLHIWLPSSPQQVVTENVHSHRWDFSSILISGGYRYQEFTSASDGTAFFSYGYESTRGTSFYSLTPAGRRILVCSFDAYLQAGSSYTLSGDVLHRVINDPNRTTATLMFQGPRIRSSVEVLSEEPIDVRATLQSAQFSKHEIAEYISSLRHKLEDA